MNTTTSDLSCSGAAACVADDDVSCRDAPLLVVATEPHDVAMRAMKDTCTAVTIIPTPLPDPTSAPPCGFLLGPAGRASNERCKHRRTRHPSFLPAASSLLSVRRAGMLPLTASPSFVIMGAVWGVVSGRLWATRPSPIAHSPTKSIPPARC